MAKTNKTVEIKISDILQYLQEGYTRTKGEKNYDPEIGSIQEKYVLNKSQIFELFRHEKLKGRKTIVKKAPAFVIVDDTVEDDTSNSNVAEIIVKVQNDLEEETSPEDENTEEVSTPDTQTSTDIDDAADEEQPKLDSADVEVVKVEEKTAESPGEDGDEWLPN